MKNWKESRNYRRIKDEHGKVIANIITVDGIDVEVSEEVFLAYSQADRRERYMTEDTPEGRVLSLDQMDEDEIQQAYVGGETVPSVEEQLLERQTAQERESIPPASDGLCARWLWQSCLLSPGLKAVETHEICL
jgi:hypothetical protein